MNNVTTAPLGEIADVVRGVTFSKSEVISHPTKGFLPVIRAGNIQDCLSLDKDLLYIPREKVNAVQILRSGDIIICTSSGSSEVVGKTAFAERDWEGTFGAFCAGIRANPEICDPIYLFYYLRSPAFRSWTRKSSGVSIKNIRKSELDLFEIPLPSHSEQRRIASILIKADGIRRKRKQIIKLTDSLLKSIFLEMFGDPCSNSKELPIIPIKDMGSVITGNTPPRKDPDNYGSGIEWIKSDNISMSQHILTWAEETLSDKGQRIGRLVPAGSTLVTCIAGSPSSIGNAALANREVAFNQQINAVIPKPEVDPYFLYCQFLVGKKLIQDASTNSMKGMVSKGKFQEIQFLNPPFQQQQKFGCLFKQVLYLSQKLQEELARSKALFESLSLYAFNQNNDAIPCG